MIIKLNVIMKRNYLWLMLCSLALTSCEFDDNGDASLSPIGWFIIIGFIVALICTAISSEKTKKKSTENLAKSGLSFADFKNVGMYAGGHPSLNDSIKNVFAFKKEDKLIFYTEKIEGVEMPEIIPNSDIPINDITDIKLEDATTIENKITVGRLLLTGVFAFAWKKKKKNEIASVTIYWSMGKFNQETIFIFEGKNAFQKANTARNELMKMCS